MPTFPLRFEDYAVVGQNIVVTAPQPTVTYLYVEGQYDLPVIGYTEPEVRLTLGYDDFQLPSGEIISIETLLVTVVTGLRLINGLITEQTMSVEFRGYQFTNLLGSSGQDRMVGSELRAVAIQGDSSDVPGGDDIIVGGPADFVLRDGDTLYGMGGNDTLYGGGASAGFRAEYLYGDFNADDQGNEFVAEGNDLMIGGDGESWFFGGGGNDEMEDGDGRSWFFGGSGENTIASFSDQAVVDYSVWRDGDGSGLSYFLDASLSTGTATIRRVDSFTGEVTVVAIDTFLLGLHGTIIGTDSADSMDIGRLARNAYGGTGNDTITGIASNGVYGGIGNDSITMADGSDFGVFGGEGNDTITVNGRFAIAYGDGGTDLITGTDTIDDLYGGTGNDTIYGQGDADVINGDWGDDRLSGGDGFDTVFGGSDSDAVFGDGGDDWLFGSEGNDNLRGGIGDDTLVGGTGRDVLRGNSGADVFYFETLAEIGTGATRDRFVDFVSGTDMIDLRDVQATTLFIGGGRFTGAAGEVRLNAANGILVGDIDGDRAADWQIFIGVGTAIVQGDFA